MRLLRLLLALAMGLGTAQACSCVMGSRAACSTFWNYQAGAVFAGTVLKIVEPQVRPGDSFVQRTVLLHVDRAYAGAGADELEIQTGRGGGDCGYPFEVGQKYLVYAMPSLNSHALGTGICTPTIKIENAAEDLAFLDHLDGLTQSVRIFGEVSDPWKESNKGLSGVKVELTGAADKQSIVTDKSGKFDVSGLTAGRYRVRVEVPGYVAYDRELDVHERGCAEAQVPLREDGRISGRVFDAEGRGVAKIRVELMKAQDRNAMDQRNTDVEGRYEFTGVRSGRYMVGVNAMFGPSAEQPYARTFYPDVHQREQGAVVTMGTAEHREGIDVHLGTKSIAREFRGRVFYPDGTAAGNANVTYKAIDSGFAMGIQSAGDGGFHFPGFEGATYDVTASALTADGGLFQSDALRTDAGESGDIRVILKLVGKGNPASRVKPE